MTHFLLFVCLMACYGLTRAPRNSVRAMLFATLALSSLFTGLLIAGGLVSA